MCLNESVYLRIVMPQVHHNECTQFKGTVSPAKALLCASGCCGVSAMYFFLFEIKLLYYYNCNLHYKMLMRNYYVILL